MTVAPSMLASGRQVLPSLALLASVAASLVAAPGADGLMGAFLAALMLAVAVADHNRYIIPNELTAAAFALALFRVGAMGIDVVWRDISYVIFRVIAITLPLLMLMAGYRRWRGRDGLGLGDIKLAAVAAAWLGWATIFAVVELAALAALGAYAVNAYVRKRPLRTTAFLPFGLFLAPAIWIGWLVETMLS